MRDESRQLTALGARPNGPSGHNDRRRWACGAWMLAGAVLGTAIGAAAGLWLDPPQVRAETAAQASAAQTPAQRGQTGRAEAAGPGSAPGNPPTAAPGTAPAGAAAAIEPASSARRIVSMGGTLTEIVYALGAGDRVVGTDRSSLYPPAAQQLPSVGYFRQFSVEGVASLKPDLVIAGAESGPPAALDALKGLGVRIELFAQKPDLDALIARIEELGVLLDRRAEARSLTARVRAQVKQATATPRPLRMLALSRHAGKLQGAGRDTAIDAQLRMLGATNVLADSQTGYKPVSAEALATLRPDVIITSPLSAPDGIQAFRQQPGVASTPAGRQGQIILLDDLLMLGFGPRVGESLQQLSDRMANWQPAPAVVQER